MKNKAEGKIHYAWFILGVCLLLNMTVQAFVMSVSNLYVVPIWKEFQVPRALVTMQSICITISSVASAPVWGRMYRTKNARILLPVALAGTAACCFLRSVCINIWWILLLAVLKGVFFTGSTLLPISILLTAWFSRKRGFAISVAAIGSSIGGVILSPFVEFLISEFGWRHADQIMGFLIFVLCVPVTALIVRNSPREIGVSPYGYSESEHSKKISCKTMDKDETKPKWKGIYILFLCGIFCMTFANGAALQLPTYLIDLQYSSELAAKVVSGYMFVGIAGKLLLGWIVDHYGVKTAIIYNCLVGALAFLCFIFAQYKDVLLGLVLFFGLTSGITSMLPTLLTSTLFSHQNYASVYGVVVSVNRFGGGIGTLLVAVLFDVTGNYRIIWPLCFCMMFLTMLCILVCFAKKDKVKTNRIK